MYIPAMAELVATGIPDQAVVIIGLTRSSESVIPLTTRMKDGSIGLGVGFIVGGYLGTVLGVMGMALVTEAPPHIHTGIFLPGLGELMPQDPIATARTFLDACKIGVAAGAVTGVAGGVRNFIYGEREIPKLK